MSDVEDGQEKVVGSEAEEPKIKPASPGPSSKALEDIVNFDEDDQDINTELFRSTIRTTPLDTDREPFGVYQLVNPDGPGASDEAKAKGALDREAIEKDALEAAKDSGGESEEELEGYSGDLSRKDDSILTLERCSSVDAEDGPGKREGSPERGVERGVTDTVTGDVDSPERGEEEVVCMDIDIGERAHSPMDENVNSEDFEIVDAEMIEKLSKEGQDEQEMKGSGEEDGDAHYEEIGSGSGEDSRTVEGSKGGVPMVTGAKMDKTDGGGEESDESGGEYIDLADTWDGADTGKEPLSPTGEKAMEVDGSKTEDKAASEEDEKEESEGDRLDTDKPGEDKKEEDDISEDVTDSAEKEEEKTTSNFDDLEVGTRLDINLQKSRARLGKTGALAHRRKPPRSSWYVEEGQDFSQFRTTDSTQPKPLKVVEEEEEVHTRSRPVPASRPKPTTRRPPGGMGGPLLIPGLGQIGKIQLKKTSNLEPKAKSSPPPPSITKPTRKSPVGHRVFPTPATRPATHSKGKAPPVPPAKTTLSPIGSKNTTTTAATRKPAIPSKETDPLSPKGKSPSSKSPPSPFSPPKGVGFRLPSPTEARPALKSRPKPMPKPRPQSIAASSSPGPEDPSFPKVKSPRTSKDDLNSDILNSSRTDSASKTPLWSADKNKKLPPIPSSKEEVPTSPRIPKWKEELMKKKKEAEAQEQHSPADDSSIKKTVIPPPLPKKDGPAGKDRAPFTTVPQWQLNLAEKNRKKKEEEHDEVDLGSRPAKERKTSEDSNKIEAKKPPLTPKPAIIPRKKFDAIPPEKDSVPSWQKNLQERRKKNEKNLLIETNGEKRDTEKPDEMASPTKKGLTSLAKSATSYRSNVPSWKLELERMQSPLSQRFNRPDFE